MFSGNGFGRTPLNGRVVRMDWIIKRKWWLFGIILLGGLIVLVERWHTRRENQFDDVIRAAAARYGADPALVKAVIWRESWFNPKARGRKGELGLMQLREEAAQEWARAEGVRLFAHFQLADPVKNTLAGTWYLRKHYRRFAHTDNPLPYALAAYNAGAANVGRWAVGAAATNSAMFVRQIGYPSTRDYVQAVLKRQQKYRANFAPKPHAGPARQGVQSANRHARQGRGEAFRLPGQEPPLC
jgi:soluble lytic murein transglycosylase